MIRLRRKTGGLGDRFALIEVCEHLLGADGAIADFLGFQGRDDGSEIGGGLQGAARRQGEARCGEQGITTSERIDHM